MRFDKTIELIINEEVSDGQGGREQLEKVIFTLNANIEELSVVETFKIYGVATTDTIKARVLGNIKENIDKIRYNNNFYKIISKRIVKNKTVFLLEVIEDGI